MKSQLRKVKYHDIEYECLAFVCPGCVEMKDGSGLHMLPVNTHMKLPSWSWNRDLEKPSLNPSILTGKGTNKVCHSHLTNGVFKFLTDSTHSLAGQEVEMPDLPDWFVREGEENGLS